MIPIARPLLGEEEARAAAEAVRSGWVAQGPRVAEFEEAFAAFVGAPHACAVSSCTTALHMALQAVGVGPGDVVITVSHSFIATANAVRHCGAEPVFVDVRPGGLNMDPAALERFLEEECEARDDGLYYRRTSELARGESPLGHLAGPGGPGAGRVAAVMPVHQLGLPCDIRAIVALARERGLPVVEDAACAVGSAIRGEEGGWERIGRPHGTVACFSFHPRKVLTTGEGGMLTTADPGLDARFRLLRQHCMGVPDTVRHAAGRVIIEDYLCTGYNFRMSDIQAAVGMVQLGRLEDMVAERQDLAERYRLLLADIPGCSLPDPGEGRLFNWQSCPLRLEEMDVPALMQALLDRGIATRPGVMNAHAEAPYLPQAWSLPHSEAARRDTVLIPLYNGLGRDAQDQVIAALREALA